MKAIRLVLIVSACLALSAAEAGEAGPKADPGLTKIVASCRASPDSGAGAGSPKRVLLIKQWHLGPLLDTHDVEKSKTLPQYMNQKAIYTQLDRWVQSGQVSEIFAEGCSAPGRITGRSPEKFNGWSMEELEGKAGSTDYPDVLTNVVYKLEAKWKDKLKARCGDDEEAIRQDQLAFSDARGIVGYLSRMEQFRSDPKREKPYLDDVIQLFHLPLSTSVDRAVDRLNGELAKSVDLAEKWIDVRSKKLVDAVVADPAPVVAVVFGGVHAAGIQKELEKKGVACQVLEPAGYLDNERGLLTQLEELLDRRLKKSAPAANH